MPELGEGEGEKRQGDERIAFKPEPLVANEEGAKRCCGE
jgi:hypothetical protein